MNVRITREQFRVTCMLADVALFGISVKAAETETKSCPGLAKDKSAVNVDKVPWIT